MSYESVDALQRTLTTSVFQYAADKKKAAGRALGTLVEIITFHTLRTWGLRDNIVIERSVPEFANPRIAHNVEFSLHPVKMKKTLEIAGPPCLSPLLNSSAFCPFCKPRTSNHRRSLPPIR